MLNRDYRDIIGGLLLVVVGLAVASHALSAHHLGTLRHIGPGGFPMALGFLLAGLGVLVILPALFRAGTLPKPEMRPLITVMIAVFLFALTVREAGIVPAIVLLTAAAVFAHRDHGIVSTLMTMLFLSVAAYLIFIVALGMPLPVYRWPF